MYKIFDLIGVRAEERQAMVGALEKARIPYYETPKADWGPGQPAIWVTTEQRAEEALGVISDAQRIWKENAAKRKSPDYASITKTKLFWVFVAFSVIVLFAKLFYPGPHL